jgi:hypothetical protein
LIAQPPLLSRRGNDCSTRIFSLLVLFLTLGVCAEAQGVRERIRAMNRDNPAAVSESQGIDVSLTLSTTETRHVQQVVRTGGKIDNTRKVVTAAVGQPDASLIKVGQRARAFAPESKSSMFQARVTRVVSQGARSLVEVTLSSMGLQNTSNYVVEITVELGEFLSVPNEAIIEEGGRRVVYVEKKEDELVSYLPHEIESGIQGELYTEIRGGLKSGDQVVTFGSFFVDSNYKLKQADQTSTAP